MSEPLIYTSKGNLPISSLQHFVDWQLEYERREQESDDMQIAMLLFDM